MTKFSDVPAASLLVVEGSAPSSPSAGNQRVYIDSADHKLKRKNSGGTVTVIESSGLLAIQAYAPGSDTTIGSHSTSTMTDMDATNAAVTFTAPASGNVLVRATCYAAGSTTGTYFWGIRESTTTLSTALMGGTNTFPGSRISCGFYITGISAGSHTYKLAHDTSDASLGRTFGGPTYGQLVIEVWACP